MPPVCGPESTGSDYQTLRVLSLMSKRTIRIPDEDWLSGVIVTVQQLSRRLKTDIHRLMAKMP